jgi:Asp-tRNA(Asn)/Glu-tRNA(Gln) amidotransferase A subunit family amidase
MYGFGDKKLVKNPINEDYFAGGSSSGSASSVQGNQVLA